MKLLNAYKPRNPINPTTLCSDELIRFNNVLSLNQNILFPEITGV